MNTRLLQVVAQLGLRTSRVGFQMFPSKLEGSILKKRLQCHSTVNLIDLKNCPKRKQQTKKEIEDYFSAVDRWQTTASIRQRMRKVNQFSKVAIICSQHFPVITGKTLKESSSTRGPASQRICLACVMLLTTTKSLQQLKRDTRTMIFDYSYHASDKYHIASASISDALPMIT